VSNLTLLRTFLDGLVHPAAQQDALTAARHRAFIAPRLIGSCAALALLPLYLALRGMPSPLEAGVAVWLVTPLLLACFLSRTGRYEAAHILSALTLSALIAVLAWQTGGIASSAAIWLVLVPLEAALSTSRRAVALSALFALAGAVLLLLAGGRSAPLDIAQAGPLAALAVMAAALYGAGIALAMQSLLRKGQWLFHAEEDRYRLLARNMTDVITRHGRNGAVLFASPAAETLFGIAPDKLTGHGLFDRVHVADRPAYLTALADAARGEERAVEFRIRGGQAEHPGHFLWVDMRCRPLDQADAAAPAPRDVVAVMREVSDRKIQQRAIEIARAESARANAGKSRFLATMSHELRTPLNAIIGFSEMLANDKLALDGARRQEYAKLINDSGRHLLAVVNNILDMSKMESGSMELTVEPFAPAQVITGCCDLLTLKARDAGIDLTVRVGHELPEIVADRRAVSQILINLVSNAIKFTDRGGRVTVAARCDVRELTVVVEDTGVGIDADDLPRIGEAFFQARASYDRRHAGTGLGLSIVNGLVRLHGGSTDISSKPGEGTRVTVRLPLNCEDKPPAARPITLERRTNAAPERADSIQVRKSA
jgi:cell cycle sensor histidine kinase DivJ